MFGNFENHCVRKYSKEVNGRYRNENESAWQERLEEKGEVSRKIFFFYFKNLKSFDFDFIFSQELLVYLRNLLSDDILQMII